MAKKYNNLHKKNNLIFSQYLFIYLRYLDKHESEKWERKDFENLAKFLGKERENYVLLKEKILGIKEATEKDCLLFEQKLIEKKLITNNN